jgi:hypothetical protein
MTYTRRTYREMRHPSGDSPQRSLRSLGGETATSFAGGRNERHVSSPRSEATVSSPRSEATLGEVAR